MSGLAEIVASNVRKVRKAKGISMAKVAEKMGITKQSVHYMETGKNNISFKNLEKISEILDLPAHAFLDKNLSYKLVVNYKNDID